MAFLAELRYPTKWYAKLIAAFLALIFFVLLATATLSGYLVYRILSPAQNVEEADLRDFPGHPDTVAFTIHGVGAREGWFFPGLRTAPVIILCHGYQSNRGELLTLVSALQDHQFNVFVFDFTGHGTSKGYTSLGFRERDELRAAIDMLSRRDDVDGSRFGLWGANLGGYVALSVATTDKRVRAVAVESVPDQPADLLRVYIARTGLDVLPFLKRSSLEVFRWVTYPHRKETPLSARLAVLAGVPKLFLQATDEPTLAESTTELFLRSPEPRDQEILPKGNYAGMLDDEKRGYENRIVSFFLLNLPPSSQPFFKPEKRR